MKLTVQYCSDLNIHKYDKTFDELIIPSAPILVVAGGISPISIPSAPILVVAGGISPISTPSYKHFLFWCSERFCYVIVCLGTVEYYGQSVEKENNISTYLSFLKKILPKNVYILNDDSIVLSDFPGFVFIGTTLWTRIPMHLVDACNRLAEEYNEIEGMNSITRNFLHTVTIEKLRQELVKREKEVVIILSHYSPIVNDVIDKINPVTNVLHNNNCKKLVLNFSGDVWICGHSGWNFQQRLKKEGKFTRSHVFIISNQWDVKTDRENKVKYKMDATITLERKEEERDMEKK